MMSRTRYFAWLNELYMSQRPLITDDIAIIKTHSKFHTN